MEADAWDYTHGELPLFCAIAATEVGGGTCEFRDVMDNAGDASALAKISAKGRFGDHEACMAFMTSIEPSAYSPVELDMLMDIKPELFGKESREKYPEVDAAASREPPARRLRMGAYRARATGTRRLHGAKPNAGAAKIDRRTLWAGA